MGNSIARGLRNLARFSGRDTRGEFWPYAGVVLVVMFVAFGVAGNWAVSPMPDFTRMFSAMGAGLAVLIALLAAAVTRRLHDRGLGGYWGLAPVLFLAIAFVGFPIMISDSMTTDTPNIGLGLLLFLNNMLYLVALAGLIFVLASPGTRGPNRYGPDKAS